MKEVIGSILDIESKANHIIDEGKEEIRNLEQKMKDDVARMQKDIGSMVETKLKQLYEEEKKEAAKSMKRINESAGKRLAAMDEFYKENRGSWVNAVFDIITGSEDSGS
ncbi:MAG: hypothetical protein JXB33_06585 [Clostridia bacterium]|nr:hypothetical protein [Clostridia bacterium]